MTRETKENGIPLKWCAECCTVLPAATHQCHGCGVMQPCWYRRQERLGFDTKSSLKVSE